MTILSKNVSLGRALKLNARRKVAIGTWKTAGDPSVYGLLDADVGKALAYIEKLRATTGQRITFTHFIGKVAAEVFARHPDINCVLRFGRLYPRKTIDVFFLAASDSEGKDLSGITIRESDQKSVIQIAEEMHRAAEKIRLKGDPDYQKMKGTMGLLPGLLAGWAIELTGFLMYSLNLWTPLLGLPRDPFGSVMITNIGSLGLDMAFAPLVPYSRVPLLVAVGAIRDTPVVKDGSITIAPVCRLGVTFDHRLIDGVHAGRMVKTFQKILENPETELPTGEALR